ncbi:MAG: translation initiation factor IF-2 [Tannerella sp.]|jgi:translation initiation factor IF-2|nr:translation initiation factor IF-2 [Tannerella sp.]
MPVKLNKVIKDLKVGLSTVVEYLNKKGYEVESNPNVKITDEQFDLLINEFGNGLPIEKRIIKPAVHGDPLKEQKTPQKIEEIKTKIPDYIKPRIVTKGKIDLDEKLFKPKSSFFKDLFSKKEDNPSDGLITKMTDEPEKIAAENEMPIVVTEVLADKVATPEQKMATAQENTPLEEVAPEIVPKATVAEEKSEIEVNVAPEQMSGTGTEAGTGTNPEAGEDPKSGTGTGTGTEEDLKSRARTGTEEASKPEPGTEEDPKSRARMGTEPGTGTEEDPKSGVETGTGEEPKPRTVTEVESNVEAKPGAGAGAKPEVEQKPEYESGQTSEQIPELKQESKTKQERTPESEVQGKILKQKDTTVLNVRKEELKEEPFRLKKSSIEPHIKVTGKIDLSTINQATSPRKKTKEEKKRERDARRSRFMEQRKTHSHPPQLNKAGVAASPKPSENAVNAGNKHKRKRIRKERVDINATPGTNTRKDDKKQRIKRPIRVEVNEEDVQKQIKETLARLTNKNSRAKGAKYRREKRDAAAHREQELLEVERRESKVLKITEFVTANDLANMMNMPVTQIISTCMSIGMMVSINQRLDAETINIVADEFGFTTEYVSAEVVEAITEEVDKEEDLTSRPPIITVMGHVDHGKTSLLDNIRKTNVIAGEAGGITQHIGAYNVKLPNGRHITFLDTPGHEAFTAMRARGAKVTDIVIIIVAADDNVMPQTVEAINHASVAGVPIVFAINKIDKPNANPEKIKEELANMNYLVEDWGGKYQSQEISAKQGIGVPDLLEKVLLEADMLELKANPDRRATGSIIESSLDKGRGFVSTVLVSNGTLKQGDIVLAGTHFGRVKAMFNERNQRIEYAEPSEPAIILGLDGAPQAGDTFNVLDTEQEAREIASRREQLQRELGLRTQKRFGLEELGRRRALGDFHELNLIVKGDVDGSVEALSDSLIKLSTEEIRVNVIHKAVGQISESDISLAETADAVIIGFQVRPSTQARRMAENEGVEVRLYSIIYDAINDVKDAMEGLLSPEIREDICGEVEVLQVFKISKVGTIAGCIVKEGKIKRTNKVRIIRDGIVVHTGELGSLKRFKDEAKEAVSGQDCGIYVNNYNDIQVGDIIEPFDQVEIKKTL